MRHVLFILWLLTNGANASDMEPDPMKNGEAGIEDISIEQQIRNLPGLDDDDLDLSPRAFDLSPRIPDMQSYDDILHVGGITVGGTISPINPGQKVHFKGLDKLLEDQDWPEGLYASPRSAWINAVGGRVVNFSDSEPHDPYSEVGVLLLNHYDVDGNLTMRRGVCTGTLIGRKTFLTAGHCVVSNAYKSLGDPRHPCSGTDLREPKHWAVYFETYGIIEAAASGIVLHPDFNNEKMIDRTWTPEECPANYTDPRTAPKSIATKGEAPADFALVRLEEEPLSVQPAILNSVGRINRFEKLTGEIVGYGRTDTSESFGIKRLICPEFDIDCTYKEQCSDPIIAREHAQHDTFKCPKICEAGGAGFNKLACENSLCYTVKPESLLAHCASELAAVAASECIKTPDKCTAKNVAQDTCSGDSGGPVFVYHGSDKLLVGTTVAGTAGSCIGNEGGKAWFTDISRYADFILDQQHEDASRREDNVTLWLSKTHQIEFDKIEKHTIDFELGLEKIPSNTPVFITLNGEVALKSMDKHFEVDGGGWCDDHLPNGDPVFKIDLIPSLRGSMQLNCKGPSTGGFHACSISGVRQGSLTASITLEDIRCDTRQAKNTSCIPPRKQCSKVLDLVQARLNVTWRERFSENQSSLSTNLGGDQIR